MRGYIKSILLTSEEVFRIFVW